MVDAVAQEQSLHGIGHLSSTTQCGPIQRAPSGVVVDGFAAKYRSRTTVSNDGRSVSARSFLACPSHFPGIVPFGERDRFCDDVGSAQKLENFRDTIQFKISTFNCFVPNLV